MKRFFLILMAVLLGTAGAAKALTVQQADSVVVGRFEYWFGSYFEQNVLVYDGSIFFTAASLARSGRREFGASGYALTNTSIAATTAGGVDTVGARLEGCTTLAIAADSFPTVLSLHNAVNDFVYYNLQDTAMIGISGGRDPDPARPQMNRLYPNPFSRQIKLSSDGDGRPDQVVKIYNLAGALKRTIDWPASAGPEITWNGLDSRGSFVPAGIYLVQVQGGKITRCHKIIKLP
jgi:hypothetical protein